MIRRLTIGVLLTLALFVVPLQARSEVCAMKMAGLQTATCADCCATMKSCVLPQQNPTDAATAPAINSTVVLVPAPAVAEVLQKPLATPVSFARAQTPRLAQSSPRLALLCTFLI